VEQQTLANVASHDVGLVPADCRVVKLLLRVEFAARVLVSGPAAAHDGARGQYTCGFCVSFSLFVLLTFACLLPIVPLLYVFSKASRLRGRLGLLDSFPVVCEGLGLGRLSPKDGDVLLNGGRD
jgi:hypothetical protein